MNAGCIALQRRRGVTRSTSWSSVSIRKSTRWMSTSTADSMRSAASSPRFYVSSAVDSRTSGFHVSLRDGLAGLDPHEVVAMRLLDGGGLSVVTSDRRRMVDCVLAMRIMLHQMQKAVPI